jgi:nitroreductase
MTSLDLVTTLRSTGAARQFHPDPVPDEVLERLLDTARFAPSGGNRQGWRVIVVKDSAKRQALRDLYLDGWYEYLAMGAAGLVPMNPLADRAAEAAAVAHAPRFAEAGAANPGFAEMLDTAPALLLILADLSPPWPQSTGTCPATPLSVGPPSIPSCGASCWRPAPRVWAASPPPWPSGAKPT